MSTRERIVIAAIVCIERVGVDAATVREIAREADTNVASINYHFQSKENLIALAMERTLDEGFTNLVADFDAHRERGLSTAAALESVLHALVEGALHHPHIAFAHLRDAFVTQDYSAPVIGRLTASIDGLARRLGCNTVGGRIALTQLWSSVLMAALLPRLLEHTAGASLETPAARRAFVSGLVRALPPPQAPREGPPRPSRKGRHRP